MRPRSFAFALMALLGGCTLDDAGTGLFVDLAVHDVPLGSELRVRGWAPGSGEAVAAPLVVVRPSDPQPTTIRVGPFAPGLVVVTVDARFPDGSGGLASRCYPLVESIRDEVALVPAAAIDPDGDGHPTDPAAACVESVVSGGTRPCGAGDFACGAVGSDCDGDDPGIFPGAPTVCRNGVDEDCDGADEPCDDLDGDGFGGCPPTPTLACDCNDRDVAINPAATEVCLDGIDQDCDGRDAPCDRDGDGYTADESGEPDCDDDDPSVHPGATETPGGACDAIDNNCNGLVDEVDACRSTNLDGDAADACPPGTVDTSGCDCNDCDPGIHGGPGSRERCANGIDDDCDASVDEGCPDPSADADGDGQAAPQDCDDTDPYAYTHAPGEPVIDLCGNGVPGNCVPGEDRPCDLDTDGDGYVEPPECEGNAAVGPLVPETCNGVDDDCDGVVDEVHDMASPPTMGCVDGTPIDFSGSDFSHCGACRNLCPPDAADQCASGVCDCSTEPGEGPCAVGLDPGCCVDGCVDLSGDPDNCGACGRRCGAGEACVDGLCTCGALSGPMEGSADSPQACPEPSALEPALRTNEARQCCAETCIDVTMDDGNCGQCGLTCGPNSSCSGRFCQCDAPSAGSAWSDCNGDLTTIGSDGCETDLENDPMSCGACGRVCTETDPTALCIAGACTPA